MLRNFFFKSCGGHRDLHFSLHDALPICRSADICRDCAVAGAGFTVGLLDSGSARNEGRSADGASTRLICMVDRRRSEEHTSELQSLAYLVCRLLLEKKRLQQRYLAIRRL